MGNDENDDPYPPLYEQYKQELRQLHQTLVSEHAAAGKTDGEDGPLVHDGRAIALIRRYWLEIDRLKKAQRARDEGFLEPLTFLIEDLAEDGEDELVAFLTEIAYWQRGAPRQ